MSVPLDPRVIEEEIARIRERESNPFLSGSRTNLFNFVVFSPEGGMDGRAEKALDFLLGKRPARIITIKETPDPRTSVFVSGRCFPDARNRGVCFEEIRIESGVDGMGADPGAWAPLLIRDLPVYLLWLDRLSPPRPAAVSKETAGGPRPAAVSKETAGGPSRQPIRKKRREAPSRRLRQAEELVDKLVIDTMRCEIIGEDPMDSLETLRLLHDETHGAMTVSDLSWNRTLPMRLHTARLFNPEDHRPRLSMISRVRLEGGSRAEGLLFFFWLADRLGWSVETGPAGTVRFTDAAGRRVETTHGDQFPLSGGFRAGFSFSDGGGDMKISCSKNGCAEVGDERGVYRFIEDGNALLDEVDTLKQDPVLLDVLGCILKSRHA